MKITNLVKKVIPALLSCLSLILTIDANSTGCVYLNQPKEPKDIYAFKKFNK